MRCFWCSLLGDETRTELVTIGCTVPFGGYVFRADYRMVVHRAMAMRNCDENRGKL